MDIELGIRMWHGRDFLPMTPPTYQRIIDDAVANGKIIDLEYEGRLSWFRARRSAMR